jgi:hypothetical protein
MFESCRDRHRFAPARVAWTLVLHINHGRYASLASMITTTRINFG